MDFAGRVVRNRTWEQFKQFTDDQVSARQWEDEGDRYTIFAFDGPCVYVCTIYRTVPNVSFDQKETDAARDDFEANFQAVWNKPIQIWPAR
jgi:hypothetical protein